MPNSIADAILWASRGRGAAAVDGGIGFCRKEVGCIDVCAS